MLPKLSQRLLIAAVLAAGGMVWLLVGEGVQPVPGLGLTLTETDAPVWSVLVLVLAGLPAVLGGILAGCSGNVLSTPFCVAGAMLPLAAYTGSIQGFLYRQADLDRLPLAYSGLIAEAVAMMVGFTLLMWVVASVRPAVRAHLPKHVLYPDTEAAGVLGLPSPGAVLLGIVAACIGGALSHLLIRVSATGQVIGSLLLAFTVAGMLARLLVPHRTVSVVIISPLLVAVAGYAWVMIGIDGTEAFMSRDHVGRITGLALALPIHYASAGVAGVTFGLGIAQGLVAGSREMRRQRPRGPNPPRRPVEQA